MTAPKPRFSWGHINVNVSNLDRSIEFYRKLGFEVFIPGIPYLALNHGSAETVPANSTTALGIPQGTQGRACIMQLDDGFPKLDLTEFNTTGARPPLQNADQGIVRLCLITEDLPAEVARLESEGVEFVSSPQSGHAELADIAVCKDPDGTLIEILQVHLERWAPFLNG